MAICPALSCERLGATAPVAALTLVAAPSFGGIAGIKGASGATTAGCAGAIAATGGTGATGATTMGLGCNTAGSSFWTTGVCEHADSSATTHAANVGRASRTGLGGRNEGVITLVFPFKFDEVVIAAGAAIGVLAAHRWTPLIDGAAALGLVEKHAHRFVDGVFSVTQHPHRLASMFDEFGKFFTGDVYRDEVVPGQARHVRRFGFDVVVAAAIPRTLRAVVCIFCSHDADFKYFDTDSNGVTLSGHNELIQFQVSPDRVL